MPMRRLTADEVEWLSALAPVLTELRLDALERLAVSDVATTDLFLKGKAQAYNDLLQLPDFQRAMEAAEVAAAAEEGEDDVGRRPDQPSGLLQWLRRRHELAGRTGGGA